MELAQLTGKFLQDGDKTLIEVILGGKSGYAALSLPFGYFFTPSAEWLQRWAKEVVCWVVYENNNPAHWVVVGFRPLANKTPEDYPRVLQLKSEKWLFTLNDAQTTAYLGQHEGFGVTVKQDVINLGGEATPAVLGKQNETVLQELQASLDKLAGFVQQLTTACTTFGVPVPPTVLPGLVQLKLELAKTKAKIPQTLSKKINLV